jgi:thioredoxin-like negative regulator of GroEL
MHKTTAGEKRKSLESEALELTKDAKAAMKAAKILPETRKKAHALEGQAESLKAEAEALRGAARREDLSVWVMEITKSTKKSSKTYGYCMASWREGDRARNVHLEAARMWMR